MATNSHAATNARPNRNHQRLESAEPVPLTVTRPELLVDGSDAEFRSLVHRLLSLTRYLNNVRDGFAAIAGITGVQYEIVMWVARLQGEEGVTVGEVSGAMRQSGAFTTIEVGKLVEKGILEKSVDPKDRRRVRLKITEEGARVIRSLGSYQRRINDTFFASLKPKELDQLNATLRGLLPCADRAVNLMQFILKQGLDEFE